MLLSRYTFCFCISHDQSNAMVKPTPVSLHRNAQYGLVPFRVLKLKIEEYRSPNRSEKGDNRMSCSMATITPHSGKYKSKNKKFDSYRLLCNNLLARRLVLIV